jgi:hypothetical protein
MTLNKRCYSSIMQQDHETKRAEIEGGLTVPESSKSRRGICSSGTHQGSILR